MENLELTNKRDQIKELQARLKQLNDEYNKVKVELHTLTDAFYKNA